MPNHWRKHKTKNKLLAKEKFITPTTGNFNLIKSIRTLCSIGIQQLQKQSDKL